MANADSCYASRLHEVRLAHAEQVEPMAEVPVAESHFLAEECVGSSRVAQAAMLTSEISQLRCELAATNSELAVVQRDGIASQRQDVAAIAEMQHDLRIAEEEVKNLSAEHDGLEHTLEVAASEQAALSRHAARLVEDCDVLALRLRLSNAARAAQAEEAAKESEEAHAAAAASVAAAEEADAVSTAAASEIGEWQQAKEDLDSSAREFERRATSAARAECDAKARLGHWQKETAEVVETLRGAERERNALLGQGAAQRRCAVALIGSTGLALAPVLVAAAWFSFARARAGDP